MSSPQLETFLARLYTDAAVLARFLEAPERIAAEAGLSPDEIAAMVACDRVGLQMAAISFARKRAGHQAHHRNVWQSLHCRLRYRLRRAAGFFRRPVSD